MCVCAQVISDSNGLAMLVEILFSPSTAAAVRLSVCNAVASLVQDRTHALSFQRAGGSHALTSVISSDDREAAATAASALGNLAMAVDAHNVQVDDSCVRSLVSMVSQSKAVDAMQAISVLCDSENTREKFIANGIEGVLIQASRSHADAEARQRAGKVLVKVLRKGEDAHQRIVALGGVGMLLGMSMSGGAEDRESALEQLEQISSTSQGLDSLQVCAWLVCEFALLVTCSWLTVVCDYVCTA